MYFKNIKHSAALGIYFLLMLISVDANAAVHVVINSSDDGPGSLRNAINEANDGDTITFGANLAGETILLTSGQFLISNDLIIDGSSLDTQVTVSGNNASRIFFVEIGSSLEINHLTLIDGLSAPETPTDPGGGAIFSDNLSTLIVKNSTFMNNIASLGTQGGAIDLDRANVFISGSLFSGNVALSGNSSAGGINSAFSTLRLENSTFSANQGSALSINQGSFNSLNNTIVDTDGPAANIVAPGSYHFSNTILARSESANDLTLSVGAELSTNVNNLCESCPGDERFLIEGLPPLIAQLGDNCLLYTSPSPRDLSTSRMPSSA